jgi:hypothetical protein
MGACTPEQRAACPLSNHYTDTHHLAFPRRDYNKGVDKQWRELSINKLEICRGLHNAIHATGYEPGKPSREEMAQEIWLGAITTRAVDELDHQLTIGQELMMGQDVA